VADLVEPDLGERIIVLLNDWVAGRTAARFSGLPSKDLKRVFRRVMYRYLDELDKE